MTTREAFEEMINERAIHETLGISSDQVRQYRVSLKKGKVSKNLMEKLLEKAGYLKKPEIWTKPQ